jgi:hypothetical protein
MEGAMANANLERVALREKLEHSIDATEQKLVERRLEVEPCPPCHQPH